METLAIAVNEALERISSYRNDIISISSIYNSVAEVHMGSLAFFKHFINYKAVDRDCEKYPIELYEYVGNTKFFSIYSVEDFHHAN